MNWRVFRSVVRYSVRTSALVREMFGEQASWSVTDHLLAGNYDLLSLIAWLNSDTKKNKRPTPIDRPGVKADSDDMAFGAGSTVKVSEFWDLWNADDEGGVIDGG